MRLYQQHIRTIPSINADYWSVAITGRVRRPLILSFDDLRQFPTETLRCAIACAGVTSHRPMLGEAVWRGVPLSALLDGITIDDGARFARVHAADRYTTVLTIEQLAGTLLVYEMDGAPLPPAHGFPARLIAPGLHGYKMPKWIERIELSDSSDGGFWEARGWSLDGTAGVKAAVLSHEPQANGSIALTGVACGGIQAITTVEISVDGGGWMPVAFTRAEPFALAHWRAEWLPPGAGDYEIRVRAASSSASAEHARVVRVRR
ncbi:MAG: molybdopterin-dependent oxidoreductase [Anaerolineae bacterium]|nr:molybdopterin-dependent oxidoreductase [Anaerolineae bacterium]